MDRNRTNQTPTALICLLLAGITAATYWPALNGGFINLDDPTYVANNPHVLSGLNWINFKWALRTGHATNWHPVTWLSHQLDMQLFGLRPYWHHLTNLLFHTANSLLLFILLKRITSTFWRSALVASLFALHPLHVESVAWISERKDVLSTFFFILTLLAYAAYAKRSGRQALPFYFLTLVLFALGLMSKPMLVTLPCVMLLLDYWPLNRIAFGNQPGSSTTTQAWFKQLLRVLLEKLPFLALTVGSSIVTFLAQDTGHAVAVGVPLDTRLANATASYLTYLSKMICPVGLAVFYPHPVIGFSTINPWDDPWGWQVITAAAVLLLVTGIALFRVRREPWFTVGWFWYLGTLVPVIGIVQVGGQALADRYTYIPLIGIFVILAWAGADFLGSFQAKKSVLAGEKAGATPSRPPSRPAGSRQTQKTGAVDPTPIGSFRCLWSNARSQTIAMLAIVLACVAATRHQVGFWRDDATLFEHALAVTKQNPLAHCNLASDYARQNNFDPAVQHYRQAIEEAPSFVEAYLGLGAVYDAMGKKNEALEQFQSAVRVRPWNGVAHKCLGSMYVHLDKREEAYQEFKEAIRLEPHFVDAYTALASLLAGVGRLDEAISQFRAALSNDPRNVRAHIGLGNVYSIQGKREEARREYGIAIALNPGNPSIANNVAWILATVPNAGIRDGAEAVKLAEMACKLTQYNEPQAVGTLAAAYAEAGRFDEAVKTAEKAKNLALASKQKALADRNEELLGFYRARKPYHEAITQF